MFPNLLLLIGAAVAGTNLSIEELSVNGVEMQQLRCDLSSGGFFAGAAVVGSFAEQKAAIDACAPQGAAARLKWTWNPAEPVKLEVVHSSTASINRCLVDALQKISPSVQGACTGVLLIGENAAAKTAAAALPAQN